MNHLTRTFLVLKVKTQRWVGRYRSELHIIGLLILGYETIVLYATFLKAYFHESKSTIVKINEVNEANLEFAVMPILVIIGLWTMFDLVITKYRGK